jgi:Ni,Fe-hydrogenase maturation factor
MKTVVIAVGNPLRGDDGIAHLVAEWLAADGGGAGSPAQAIGLPHIVHTQQLTPEIAAELESCDLAVMVDADIKAAAPVVSRLREGPGDALLSHVMSPAHVIALARKLYGFHGEAWLCRLPARDFTAGAPVSREAEMHVAIGGSLVRSLLERTCMSHR